MTDAEGLQFHAGMVELGIVHRLHVDRALSRSYFKHLQELPLDLVLAALGQLGDHAGEFFPKTEAIRRVADELASERAAADHAALVASTAPALQLTGEVDTSVPLPERKHWNECNSCQDSGMRPVCPGCLDPTGCINRKPNDTCAFNDAELTRRGFPLGYTLALKECECKANNKTYQRTHPPPAQPTSFARRRSTKRKPERSYYDAATEES